MQEYHSLLCSIILFVYGILYQAVETTIVCYLGRKLFYKLFSSKKTTVLVP